jgi:hypothetical protein
MLTTTFERQSGVNNGVATTLAAVQLNLRNKPDQEYLLETLLGSKISGRRAWRHYDRLGTVRYPLNRAMRLAGAAKLHAVLLDDEGKIAGPIKRGQGLDEAIDVVNGIYSPVGGVRGLIERYFIHMKVPADSHLIRVVEGKTQDGYMFLSPDELTTDASAEPISIASGGKLGNLTWVTRPGGPSRPVRSRSVARKDYLGRMWMPSAHWLDMPDPVLSTLDADCDLLLRMQTMLRAQMRSRASTSGFLFFPQSLRNLAAGERTASGPQELTEAVNEILSTNIQSSEEGDAADVSHIVISGPDDAGEKIREIVLGQETKETDLKLRKELFDNIMFALDINTRASKGDSETRYQNWNDTSDELRLAVIPDIEAMCWGLTRLVLRKELVEQGRLTPEQINRVAVSYDLSEASVRINQEETANQLYDRGELSGTVNRRVAGFNDDDKPDDDEYIRMFGYTTKNPYLAFFGMKLPDDFDWEKAMMKPDGAPADSSAGPPNATPGAGNPGSPSDTKTEDKPSKAPGA